MSRWRRPKITGTKPPRPIPNTNEITTFFHCGKCMGERPPQVSPRQWMHLEIGFTPLGLQVWCVRCECNVCHIDFQGQRHPANVGRIREPGELPPEETLQ